MVTHHEVLEHGDFGQRQQVVRWMRSFPFAFLSDREYVIARRMFKEDGRFYGITKVRLPAAAASAGQSTTRLIPAQPVASAWQTQLKHSLGYVRKFGTGYCCLLEELTAMHAPLCGPTVCW
jgi:hypothetical protein